LPFVIEPSLGVDRLFLAVICDSYYKEIVDNEERLVLKINPALAPIKATILPLVKKIHGEKANDIYTKLSKYFNCSYDEAGSIGKRYRRSDAIGTPYCITIDDNTINENIVTIRNRDTMEQITLKIDEIKDYIESKIVL
jgi:glycyl-tRNA synthetase